MGKSLTTADILRMEDDEFFLKIFQSLLGTVMSFSTPAEFAKYGNIKMSGFKEPSRRLFGVMCDFLSETSDGKYFIQRYVAYLCEEALIKLELSSYKILTEKSAVKKSSFLEDIMIKKLLSVIKPEIRESEKEILFMSKFQTFLLDTKNFPLKVPIVYAKIVTFNDAALEKLTGIGLRRSF